MITIPGSPDDSHQPFSAGSSRDRGFLPWEFINFSFPYRRVESGQWQRTNGDVTLTITGGPSVTPGRRDCFIAYGKYARAIMLWLCTEAKLTSSPRIEVSQSYRGFMKQLGLTWNRGSAAEAVRQLQALLGTTISVTQTSRDAKQRLVVEDFGFRLSFRSSLTFGADDHGDLDDEVPSWVELSDEFYKTVLAQRAVPIKRSAWLHIAETSKSPLALDVYTWLAYRLHEELKKPVKITWEQLHAQFGSTTPLRSFKPIFRTALTAALEVYPEANVVEEGSNRGKGFKGLVLKASRNALETAWDRT